jgi:hypothetical protein
MNHFDRIPELHRSPDAPDVGGGGGGDAAGVDRLLREWHEENATAARAGRDRILEAVASEAAPAGRIGAASARTGPTDARNRRPSPGRPLGGSHLFSRSGLAVAALLAIVAFLSILAVEPDRNAAMAGIVQVPEGGRLEAFAPDGELIGPCPLEGTDVAAEISGPIVSVSLTQRYSNTYDMPIEAVYTFPMSNRAAVHRMRMTIVDRDGEERIVEGEIKERALARMIYEQAKEAGYVASLLEQERPNIFTQSVANIEAGATVIIEIGYLEVVRARDGEYAFEFPTVVGPRYIPGSPSAMSPVFPPDVMTRRGIILRGPCGVIPFGDPEHWNEFLQRPGGFDALTFEAWMRRKVVETPERFDPAVAGMWNADRIFQALTTAVRIDRPAIVGTDTAPSADSMPVEIIGAVMYDALQGAGEGNEKNDAFRVPESFTLYANGYGEIGGRWFVWRLPEASAEGGGFAADTDQVPDASRITPMPVRPGTRAGHDISIDVRLDTGGVPIASIEAPLHEILERTEGVGRVDVSLARRDTIPNRDFVLRWRLEDDAITESIFTHVATNAPVASAGSDIAGVTGGYLTMVLAPPARIADEDVRPRELVFVLDTSGSMRGFPLEKSKAVVAKAIEGMRANDTFNLITFAGKTRILWPEPRPATEENRELARNFVDGLAGGGGTEMMQAINQALVQSDAGDLPDAAGLANLPADGRMVSVAVPYSSIMVDGGRTWLVVRDGLRLPLSMSVSLPTMKDQDPDVELLGRWLTIDGERRFEIAQAGFAERTLTPPMRIVTFLTDGYVGNDRGIIQAVRDNARSTRVFALGVGNSVNRYLLDELAREGRGAADYVLLADGADEIVERFSARIATPVLTDIEVTIEGVAAFDILPKNPAGLLPDLFDAQPILIHARYAPPSGGAIEGTVVITGNTGTDRYERRVPVRFSATAPDHGSIATLWARAKVDDVLAPHLEAVEQGSTPPAIKTEVVRLGEDYALLTPFTSFVAVEKTRVVVGGRPMLVTVPIELPEGTDWQGFFGPDCPSVVRERGIDLGFVDPGHWASDRIWNAEEDLPTESAFGASQSVKERAFMPPPPSSRAGSSAPFGAGGGAAMPKAATRSGGRGRSAPKPSTASGRATRGGGGFAASSASTERGLAQEGSAIPLDSAVESPEAVVEDSEDQDVSMVGSADAVVEAIEEIAAIETPDRRDDFEGIWRRLDRRLLLLAFGVDPDEIAGLPRIGVDGRPWLDGDTVEISLLVDAPVTTSIRASLEEAGLRIEGTDAERGIVVGRIPVARLFDLAALESVRRATPSSGA